MILNIRAVPKSSRKLVKEEGNFLKVYLTASAEEGLANAQLIELLSRHLKFKKYQIKIIKGEKTRDKLVEITDVNR